jgi:hypothetical protein
MLLGLARERKNVGKEESIKLHLLDKTLLVNLQNMRDLFDLLV